MLKKIRHMIKAFQFFTVIYIDHNVILNIVKQIFLFIIFIDKLNLRLIKTLNYLQRFNLDIRYKSRKQHIVFDILSRLTSTNINELTHNVLQSFANDELNVLFIASFIKMNNEFRDKIFKKYQTDFNWQKIYTILNIENDAKLFFY